MNKMYPQSLKIFNKRAKFNTLWDITCSIEVDARERHLLPAFKEDSEWKNVWEWAKQTGRIYNMTQAEYYAKKDVYDKK